MRKNVFRAKVPNVKELQKENTLWRSTSQKGVNPDTGSTCCQIRNTTTDWVPRSSQFEKFLSLVAWTNTNVQIIAMEVTIMANVITDTLVSKKLQLSVAESGDSTITRTFTRINADATKEDLYKAAKAIAGLMSNTVAGYYHSERSLLSEVASEG